MENMNKRYKLDRNEKSLEFDLLKDHITKELRSLKFESPILEVNLEDVESGNVTLQVGKDLLNLNLKDPQDREFIRDKLGDIGLRVLPGDPPRLSRPNYENYLN